jgi:hypothetical protein
MSEKSTANNHGIGFFGLLFLIFLTLKLTGFIAWSWWWISAPLWAPFTIAIVLILIGAVIASR